MKLMGRVALILALALAVCGVAWGVQQYTSGGEAAGNLPAGMVELQAGQARPVPPDGEFARPEGKARGREGGDLLALTEVAGGIARIAAVVLIVVLAQTLVTFMRRPRRPAAV